MAYRVIITDPMPPFPGKIEYGPFLTRTQAEQWRDREKAMLERTLVGGAKDVTFEIVRG